MTTKIPSKKSYATVSVEESPKSKDALPTAEAESISSSEVDINKFEVDETWSRGEVQPPVYRDKKFAIAFVVHLLVICVAVPFAPSAIRNIVQSDNIHVTRNKRNNDRMLTNIFAFVNPGKRRIGDNKFLTENFESDVSVNSTSSDQSSAGGEEVHLVDHMIYEDVPKNNDDLETSSSAQEHNTYYTDEEVEIFKKAVYFSIFVVMASLIISVGFTLGALYLLKEQAQNVIKGSLFFIVGYFLLSGILALVVPSVSLDNLDDEDREMVQAANEDGKVVFAVFDFILALIFACYAKAIWRDIPFAAANLKTGVTACKANLGVFAFAFVTPLINIIIFIMQLMALISMLYFAGAFEDDPSDLKNAAASIIMIFFTLSAYWTSEVTKNISTVIVSGTVGTWWFAPLEASSFCSSAVADSFKRATSYSFGSICCGSLLVAILNVIIDSLKRSRTNRNCILLSCVITCILQLLERLAEYFNKWAFVYVGLYGYDYMTAGKNVVTLFRARGWSSIISDNLVNRALMMVSTFIALATGLIITGIWDLFELSDSKDQVVMIFSIVYFYAAFIIALMNANQLLSVVGAAADTSVVCFAEASSEFEESHPQLSAMMHETYAQAWPDVDFRREVV